MSNSTVFVKEESTIQLCLFHNNNNYLINVPKSWLKKNPQRKWQYILPNNVKSLRITESLFGFSIDDMETYPTNDYIRRLFLNESSYD